MCAFSPHPSFPPQLNPPPFPTSTVPLDLVHVSFIVVPVIPSPHCPLPTPPCPLLDCSKLQCLWLYFVSFFLLFIMFQLKVRSYGICPSLSGLFHLLLCSPVPSMLLQRVEGKADLMKHNNIMFSSLVKLMN